MNNLDMKCAELGRKISNERVEEKAITEALGVLQEDGLYAFFLFCRAKDERKPIASEAMAFLKNDTGLLHRDTSGNNLFDRLRDGLCNDIDRLFLAKELLERALVYGRYHAKAKEEATTPAGGEAGV